MAESDEQNDSFDQFEDSQTANDNETQGVVTNILTQSPVRDSVTKRRGTPGQGCSQTVNSMDDAIKSNRLEKNEKNIRRRVYDALNVQLAAGVLKLDGKFIRPND